jgi:hypothetical protein
LEKHFLQLSLGGKEPLVLINDGKRENILDDSSTFDRMEVGRGSFGELEILEEFNKT